MLIQFRISEKDDTLTDLISKLEEESNGKRGYVGNKLRDMLKAYTILSEYTGETDPYKLMMKLASQGKSQTKQEDGNINEAPAQEIDAEHWFAQFGNFE